MVLPGSAARMSHGRPSRVPLAHGAWYGRAMPAEQPNPHGLPPVPELLHAAYAQLQTGAALAPDDTDIAAALTYVAAAIGALEAGKRRALAGK